MFHLPDLPPEVELIKLSLNKILPSTIVIVLDVRLNRRANVKLEKLQEDKYLPETRVESIYPQDRSFGFSSWTSERRME